MLYAYLHRCTYFFEMSLSLKVFIFRKELSFTGRKMVHKAVLMCFKLMLLLGSVVEVFHDKECVFTGLFFQDYEIRNTYKKFPELLMVDATYKLTDLRMPLFLMLGIDGNGHSQVISVYLTSTETAAALTHMLEVCL